MRLVRHLVPVLVGSMFWAVQLGAQDAGSITGRVVDGTTQQPLAEVNVLIEGTQRGTLTRNDGSFTLSGVPAGSYRLRLTRIGYGPLRQDVTLAAGATETVQLTLQPQAAILEPLVVTGYGTQRREAITGSVASVDAGVADVGVNSNVNRMLQGRVAGLSITTNNGEPGAGAQIRIRGGTSLSASNEPLYVIDGVPIENREAEPGGFALGDAPAPRSPLNLLNPSDVRSITILKDAAATAIYGSRAANGVILIETKKGGSGGSAMEYDSYVAVGTPARQLDVLTGAEYRQFIQDQIDAASAPADTADRRIWTERLARQGPANTDWADAVTQTSITHNHNLSFAGGSENTRYRASLNYMNQEGVALGSGFERIQGRLNGTHHALDNRLRIGLNVTTSHIGNDYLTYEQGGGFEGGVFQNVAVFNPTQPVTIRDTVSGQSLYWELGCTTKADGVSGGCPAPSRQSVRNPVALAEQIADFGNSTRTLGNVSAELDLIPGLTAQVNVGTDRSEGIRRVYFPRNSAVGAEWQGLAQQRNRDNTGVTLQTLLTLRRQVADVHGIDIVGGYEFSEYRTAEFGAEGRNYISDALGFNSLGAGATVVRPYSWREETRLVSFFGRANYSFSDRYFLTGVLRYDGSSRFAEGHKWALFPAVSASWRISEEGFMRDAPFSISDLRLRAGWGKQGNPAVPPYSSLILLEATSGARAVFGETAVTGVVPTRNLSPDLKWEETTQFNVALDYGFSSNRFSGTIEYYVKNTSDLLLDVTVAQPAIAATRLENIGKIRNQGLEISLDALAVSRPNLTWRAGLVFAAEKNRVRDLGGRTFITTGGVSGQGQSNQVSQRIMPGHPLGTFFGPEFIGVNAQGKQLFSCVSSGPSDTRCVSGQTTSPAAQDYKVIGNAKPDVTLGFNSQINWGKFDASFLIRAEVGQDVFNNTALVYATKGNALQDKNFLRSALTDPTDINEPAIFSSRWIEGASFVRLQNVTLGYLLDLPGFFGQARSARLYVSADNLILLTGYSGLDPEVHAGIPGLAVRGIDYISYPRARTVTAGMRLSF